MTGHTFDQTKETEIQERLARQNKTVVQYNNIFLKRDKNKK